MALSKILLLGVLLALAVAVSSQGQEKPVPTQPATGGQMALENWWHRVWSQVEFHRNRVNVWPEPFVPQDRELVRRPFRQMVDNGWKAQNTLTDYLFDPATNELTTAGHAKLHHLLTQVPPHRRQVYVLEAATQEETAARVASVYRSLAQIAPDTAPCPVLTTKIVPRGGEGWYVYEVEQAYRGSLLPPRLSSIDGNSTGGDGSSTSNDEDRDNRQSNGNGNSSQSRR